MEFHPDLILMDPVMLVTDGFKATELIRQIPAISDVIVISVSASVSEKVRKKRQFLKLLCSKKNFIILQKNL
ncbi:hypothetical protein [Desulfonema magnum]|uniref:Response regulator domain-containing protein n=1 Tax=Desulfonema magnum TaxID=45655 RepID=A0A975GQS9_9BACT|nr:response regulator domain-containing protein [Desulfonema magnum]